MQKPEYQNVFAISQSAIKAFKTKPIQKFKQIYIDKVKDDEDDDDQDKFAFGSLVDTLAFEPDLLAERFFITSEEVEIPGEKVKYVLDKTYAEAKEIIETKQKLNAQGNLPELLYIPQIDSLGEFEEIVFKYAKEIKLGGSTWTRGRIFDNVIGGINYYQMLAACNGRAIITPQDNADAIEMVKSLQTNEYTAPYFVQQEGETLLFQQEVYTTFKTKSGEEIPVKGAIDIIRFIHSKKQVVAPDLKTSYSLDFFIKQARSFDYVNQASFYMYLLSEFLKEYEGGKYKDYEILLPMNIVIDKKYKIPYIYQYRLQDLEISREGSKELNVEGWINILENIAWHMKTGIWTMPREMYENHKIILKIFNTHDED